MMILLNIYNFCIDTKSWKNHPELLQAILGQNFGFFQKNFFQKSKFFKKKFFFRFFDFFRFELKNAKKVFFSIVRSGHLRLRIFHKKVENRNFSNSMPLFFEFESPDRSDTAYYASIKWVEAFAIDSRSRKNLIFA